MKTKEKRSEKFISRLRKSQRLFWWGAFIIVFNFVFWVSFVESTTEYPSWTRDVGIGIFAIGGILWISALIMYVDAKMYE